MKSLKTLIAAALLSALSLTVGAWAAEPQHGDHQGHTDAKLKPYTLKTCAVSGEKLGGMGDPYVYKYKDREIKFCCKGCLKDFNKDPEKFIKKIEEGEKQAK